MELSQTVPIRQTAALTLLASVETQTSLDVAQPDANVYNIQAIYSKQLVNMDTVRFTLGSRLNDATFDTNTFTDHSATIGFDLAKPVWGARLSGSLGVGAKAYDEFSLSLDGRRDQYVTLGSTAIMENVSYFGFSPSLSLSATKTASNVTRFSTLEITGRLGIESNF